MRFTIQKDYLVRSVQDVMKAVSSRTTIPILTGIKVVATEEGVTLTGSDADISIESFIPVEENGKAIDSDRAAEALQDRIGGDVLLLAEQAEPGEAFGHRQQDQQILAPAEERKEIEEEDGAAEKRHHDRGRDGEVVGGGVELGKVH